MYRVLSSAQLNGALLGVADMPPGYAKDTSPDTLGDHTFCNYKVPVTQKAHAKVTYTKGGGLAVTVAEVSLKEYASPKQAQAAFTALSSALETCHGETYAGSKLAYDPMSVVKVGDKTLGVRITSGGMTILDQFALDGPVVVSAGNGGMMSVDANEVTTLIKAQVDKYDQAAKQ